MEKSWFVFYTKSRHEKKVRDFLLKGGFEPFLPMQKVVRQWSDRKKKIEVPLFNSYIFVHAYEHEINTILQTPGISWSIKYNGKPAALRQEEYEMIQRFISSGLFLEAQSFDKDVELGDKAQVVDGPLRGISGILSGDANNEKFSVVLEGINQVIRVEVPRSLLKKI